MVRVFIKGGVWKNSEDEILKAAVMKYGKQQWARVASLLNRKSAKQCKARWNEWLDPSVKKVEWSRAEDEKLLHLAKLLPAQWKTVAPLLGRTATQCQDRYERLLDEAAAAASGAASGTEEGAGGEGGVEAGAAAAAVTVDRKLRPGEIDPHPETKPARPDPIDMDEDEIEMLQEARARLANTQGKKAKRKQREKLLAEAKRLADLQKRRELKAAGLLSSQMSSKARTRKRQREIDFGVEIPFHKPAPAGYHDVSDEKVRTEAARAKRLRDINYQKINEEQYRSRDREAMLNEKKERNRLRNLERDNMQLAVAIAAAKSDPTSVRNRELPNLPAPKRSDDEFAQQTGQASGKRTVHFARNDITDGLVGDYPTSNSVAGGMSATASAAVSTKGDYSIGGASVMSRSERIQREAQNLRRLERGETPLLGGINSELNAGGAGTGASLMVGEEEEGINATIDGGDMSTAAAGTTTTTTTLRPDLRDQLGLNTVSIHVDDNNNNYPASNAPSHYTLDETASVGGSTLGTASLPASSHAMTRASVWQQRLREERRAARRARQELEDALAALPTPQFEYELAVPGATTVEEEDDDDNKTKRAATTVKDQAEVDALHKKELQRRTEKMYESQSSVLKRQKELPRPLLVASESAKKLAMENVEELAANMSMNFEFMGDEKNPKKQSEKGKGAAIEEAVNRIQEEAMKLMRHDAIRHPPPNLEGKKSSVSSAYQSLSESDLKPLESLEEEELSKAKEMLQTETKQVIHAAQAAMSNSSLSYSGELDPFLVACNIKISRKSVEAQNEKARIQSMSDETKLLETEVKALKKRNDKLEQKLAIHNGGYQRNCLKVLEQYKDAHTSRRTAEIEAVVYKHLARQEADTILARRSQVAKSVNYLEKRESLLQQEYGSLLHTKKRLQKRLN